MKLPWAAKAAQLMLKVSFCRDFSDYRLTKYYLEYLGVIEVFRTDRFGWIIF